MTALDDDPVFGALLVRPATRVPCGLRGLLSSDGPDVLRFQDFSRDDVIEAWRQCGSKVPYSECLRSLGFSFAFPLDMLAVLFSAPAESDAEQAFCARFVLHTFVAWHYLSISEHLPVILDALLRTLDSPLQSHTLRAIDYCCRLSFGDSAIADFGAIFPLFARFFGRDPRALAVQSLLPAYLKGLQHNAKKRDGTAAIRTYLGFLADFSRAHPADLSIGTIADIIYALTGPIATLDANALEVLCVVAPLASSDLVISMAMAMPMAIRKFIADHPSGVSLPSPATEPIPFPSFSPDVRGQFNLIDDSPFEIDFETSFGFNDKPSLKSIIPEDVRRTFTLVAQALRSHPESLKVLFALLVHERDSHLSCDFLLALITLFRKAKTSVVADLFWEGVLNSPLFDERIVCLSANPMFLMVDRLRALVFDISMVDGFPSLAAVLKSFTKKKPQLLGEVFHRLIWLCPKLSSATLESGSLIRIVSLIGIYLQMVHLGCRSDLQKFVGIARSSVFLFIDKVFNDRVMRRIWLEYPLFHSSFLSFLFEVSVRKFVLSVVKFYLVECEKANAGVVNGLRSICDLGFSRISDPKYTTLLCDIMETLNDYLALNTSNTDQFSEMSGHFCDCFSMVSTESGEQFLVHAMDFFAITSHKYPLTSIQFDGLAAAVERVCGDNPSASIVSHFMFLLAGTRLSTIAPAFIVRQPTALKSLVKIHLRSANMLENLDFIIQLLDYSFQNSVILNRAAFDVYLLDLVNSHKNDNFFNEEVLRKIFDIVSHIARISCSPNLFLKFVSLLCQSEDQIISKYEKLFLNSIMRIIHLTNEAPEAWLSLIGSRRWLSVTGITNRELGDTFSILLWIFLDAPTCQAQTPVFEMLDQNLHGMIGFINGSYFMLTVLGDGNSSTTKCDQHVPRRCWTPLCFIYKREVGKTFIHPVFEAVRCRQLEFSWGGFRNGPVTLAIGYADKLIDPPAAHFASISIYEGVLGIEDMTGFVQAGPRGSGRTEPRYQIRMTNEEGYLKCKTKGNCSGLLSDEETPCSTTFVDVLLSFGRVSVFLPLFSIIQLETIEGKRITELFNLIVDLMASILTMSTNIQNIFNRAHGFHIIGSLIRSSSYPFTYNDYTKFFGILQAISNVGLQKSLIESILVNFELISKAQNQIRIVRHWGHTLRPDYPKLFAEVAPMADLLMAARVYFTDETVRQAVIELLVCQANDFLTSEELQSLVSSCLASTDTQAAEILVILMEIVRFNGAISNLTEDLTFVTALQGLNGRNCPQLFIKVLDLTIEMHAKGLLSDLPVEVHCNQLLQGMTSSIATVDVLHFLTMKIKDHNLIEFIPLCCFIALNLGDSDIADFILAFDTKISLGVPGRFWTAVLAVHSMSDVRQKIFRFVLGNDVSWKDFIDSMEMVSPASGLSSSPPVHDFLMLLAHDLLEHPDSDKIGRFCQLCSCFMFFRDTSHTQVLERTFALSPFARESGRTVAALVALQRSHSLASDLSSQFEMKLPRQVRLGTVTRKSSFTRIAAAMTDGETTTRQLKLLPGCLLEGIERVAGLCRDKLFLIRTDNNGDWLDKDLAVLLLRLTHNCLPLSHVPFDLLTCGFLVRYQPAAVLSHLSAMQLAPGIHRAHMCFFHLIMKHCGHNYMCEYFPPSPDAWEVFSCLESIPEKLPLVFENTAKESARAFIRSSKAPEVRQTRSRYFVEDSTKFLRTRNEITEKWMSYWKTLWRSLTFDLGPWESAVPRNSLPAYKRSPILTTSLYPVLIERKLSPDSMDSLDEERIAASPSDVKYECVLILYDRKQSASFFRHESAFRITCPGSEIAIDGKAIRLIFARRRFHRPTAVEIVLHDGRSFFIDFPNVKSAQIIDELRQVATTIETPAALEPKTQQWANGRLSNFEYLLFVNRLAGRTFSDFIQYPIFPWVVTNFVGDKLDLSVDCRDLQSPIGALDKSRFLGLVRESKGYLFGTAPVTMASVCQFLRRCSFSDRVESGFDSIADASASASGRVGDYRELIPEFFYFPEFLQGVALPPWATSPHSFVYKHRAALESPEVSQMLHFWIDLMFGVDQRSEDNSFPLFMHEDCPEAHRHIQTQGQMPQQVFLEKHPQRCPVPREMLAVEFTVETKVSSVAQALVDLAARHLLCTFICDKLLRKVVVDVVKQAVCQASSIQLPAPVKRPLLALTRGGMAIGDLGTPVIHFIVQDKWDAIRLPFGNLTGVAADGDYIVCTGTDMMTRVYQYDKALFCVQSFRGEPTCAAVSTKFGVFVAGTADGSLMICSLGTGAIKRGVSLGARKPLRIIMSPSWGFVAIWGQCCVELKVHWELCLFSVNGEQLGSVPFDADLAAWEVHATDSGSDFMTLGLKSGSLYNFELYFLNIGKRLSRVQSVVAVQYVTELGAVVVVGAGGTVALLPVAN
jgi:hypothetical protein